MPRPRLARALLPAVLALASATSAAQPAPAASGLTIAAMRARSYPGSALTTLRALAPGANYGRSVVSYRSDGLKINALLTVPTGRRPAGGWPAIVFIHGYIPPAQYRTTERYVAYLDAFARAGYVVLKPDLRGHGSSEGSPSGAYWSPDYTVDTLNALASLRKHAGVDPKRVGVWGHSMGGHLALRAMVIDKTVKAGVMWAGVVAPHADLLESWRYPGPIPAPWRRRREEFTAANGTPRSNPAFYRAISANSFLGEGVGPIQLHHGTADREVPLAFSQTLAKGLRVAGQAGELFTYAGDDHNLSRNLSLALRRSVAFFDRHLKDAR